MPRESACIGIIFNEENPNIFAILLWTVERFREDKKRKKKKKK